MRSLPQGGVMAVRSYLAGLAGRLAAGIEGGVPRLRIAEQAVSDPVRFASELFDSIPVALSMRDAAGKYLFVNRTWERNFGDPREKVVGTTVRQRIERADAARLLELDRRAFERGPGVAETIDFVFRGRHLLQTRTVMAHEQGGVLGVLVATLDVTERRRQEALTRALIQENPNPMFMKDPQGRYVEVNDAWLKLVGLSREQAIGRTVLELFPDKESERYHAEDLRILSQGAGASEMESQRMGPDGKLHWLLIRKAVLRGDDGAVLGLIGTNTDVSRLREYDAQLAFEQRRLDLVVRATRVGIVDWDGRTHATFYSPRFREILGYPADTDTSKWPDYFKVLIHPEEREQITRRWRDFVLGKGRDGRLDEYYAPEEYRLLRADGTYVWVQASGIAVRDETGFVTRWIAAITDISERRAQEEALVTEQKRLALVVHSAKVGIIDWDGVRRTAYFSPRFKEILAYDADADTSRWQLEDMVHAEDRRRVLARFRDHIVGRREEVFDPIEYRMRRADGTFVWVQAQGVTVRDAFGYATRFISTLTDITERRAQEEALRESVRLREEVERISRHDLKTPLNSVIAVSRLLREGARLPPEQEELLSIVERAGYRILSMVNLSLDIFRMEQGGYQFRPQTVDLSQVAHRVAADLESQAASKEVAIRLRQSGRSLARAEELLCYSMLANLVKNAIEAAPERGVVSVTVEGSGPSVRVHVHNASAVSQKVHARFFEKYSTSGKSAGLGLGNYSARLMARVQEGDVNLHSSEEAGTTVSVRLHAAAEGATSEAHVPAPTATRAERLPALPALRVLVVDDDEFNRLVLRRYLPSPPLKVEMAVNGRAALEAAQANWPDVVLLDLEMPVMDGYEAAVKLRSLQREGRTACRIIAISSNDDPAIMQRALDAGCDYYLVKPAARETLWGLIAGAHLAGDVDADLRGTLPQFLASRRALLGEMSQALEDGDRVRFRRLAHKLSGSFALYGFKWAAEECRWLQAHAAAGQSAELARRIDALQVHLEAAAAATP